MTQLLPYLGGLGGVASLIIAFVVLLKVGVEKTDVKIGTADKVMVGQDRFIEALEKRVDQLVEQLVAANTRIDSLSASVETLRDELLAKTMERDQLKARVTALEFENTVLKGQIAELTRHQNGGT